MEMGNRLGLHPLVCPAETEARDEKDARADAELGSILDEVVRHVIVEAIQGVAHRADVRLPQRRVCPPLAVQT